MCPFVGTDNLMGATAAQGTPTGFAAGALAENTRFLRMQAFCVSAKESLYTL